MRGLAWRSRMEKRFSSPKYAISKNLQRKSMFIQQWKRNQIWNKCIAKTNKRYFKLLLPLFV